MNAAQKAMHLFENGLNCSQAILTAFGEPYGIDSEIAKKLGRPWGGGVGPMGGICGAVTGAIMVLGLAQSGRQDEAAARNDICLSVQKLVRHFEQRHGTSVCKDLLGADFNTEEGQRKIKEEMLVKKLCPKFVEDAGCILAELVV
ncbi:putative C_GCAxxG_C_C family redox protein [Syntrophobacter sp. SbD2]|nr:putative C_GCAxxG_C_C family redox protein [Syntrophobacter sp. SbD2]